MNARCRSVCRSLLLFSFLLILTTSSAFGQTPARVLGAVDNARRITLAGNVHPLARAEYDRGAVPPAQPMKRILLLLQRSDAQEAALQTYLEQQQDKSSPNYHAWLAPAEFGALYGPADADVQAVTQWLASQGFTVEKVYSGKTVIEFSGNAAQLQAAFATAIHNYEVNGKTYVANANDPQIPAALAPVVAGIVSLNNFPRQSHIRLAGQARKIAGTPGLQPLFTFPNGSASGNFYGVAPGDFATIYNSKGLIAAGNDGTGQTIAVVGETNINVADVQAFRQMFGLSANFEATNVILNGEDPGITSGGEELEADLDVQWSGATAPGAAVKYVVSASTPASQGIDLSALYIIEYNLAGVLSESYGNCEAGLLTGGNAFYNSLWEQAAAQGITVILSAGDGGSAGCDDFTTATAAAQGLAVSGLASTPYNVALGGTDFDQVNKWATYWSATNNPTTGASALSYIPEIPWNESCAQIGLTGCGSSAPQGSMNIIAGSGGASTIYGKPKWQMGVTGMPNDNHRDQPDVSLFASPGFDGSGYIVCAGTGVATGPSQCNLTPGVYNFSIVGGTSAAAPAFAGVMALVNQYQGAHGGTARQGNANYVLYPLAKKSGASCTSSATEAAGCIFNDVTKGNSSLPTGQAGIGTNSVPCQGASPNCSASVTTATGVLVEPTSSSTTEAWTATAGYDLTTGLGSVNVNNLATNWGTVNTVPTTTTLTLSPVTGITHGTGESVTVNVTVTPTTGTATGDVALIATLQGPNGSTTQGLDQFTLASGKIVNGTTKSLPGGTYNVTAHYAGDGTNAPSDSAPVNVTVTPELSHTFIVIPTFDSSGNLTNGNATSVTYGSNYFIRMYVTDKNAIPSTTGPPNPACYQENALTCPSGTVTLTDNGNALGTGGGGAGIYNLNVGGYTRNLAPNLTGGAHSLVATYSGDNSYQANSSATVTLTVTPAPTSVTWTYSPGGNVVVGQQFSLTVLAGAGIAGALPAGTVTFYDGNIALTGAVTYSQFPAGNVAILEATGTFMLTTAGSHIITASYSGDANYAPSTSSPDTVVVVNPTTATVTFNPSTLNYGATATITAIIDTTVSASNTALKPTGNATLYASFDGPITNGVSINTTADPSGNWEIQLTATITPSSSENFTVNYTGDGNYQGASANSSTLTVIIPDFALGPANLNIVATVGQPASGQITLTPLTQTASTVTLALSPAIVISGYNVSLSPQQIALNGSPATATLSITPSNSAGGAFVRTRTRHANLLPFPGGQGGTWWLLGLTSILGAFFFLTLPHHRKKYRTALGLSIASLIFLALGCGGGSGGGTGGGGGGGSSQPTTITLATTNSKAPLYSPFTVTATVTGTSGKPLTGYVNIYNFGSLYLTDGYLTNGQLQIIPQQFTWLGAYQLTAEYTGDTYNAPSQTASPMSQIVTGMVTTNIQGTTGGMTHILQATVGIQ